MGSEPRVVRALTTESQEVRRLMPTMFLDCIVAMAREFRRNSETVAGNLRQRNNMRLTASQKSRSCRLGAS